MAKGSEKVTLCWPNHGQFFLEKLWTYFKDEYCTDVELTCSNGRTLKAHRLVLAIFCPKLKDILCGSANNTSVDLNKLLTHDELMYSLLEFVYRGKVTVSRDRLEQLLSAADSMGVEVLASDTGGATTTRPDKHQKVPESASPQGVGKRKKRLVKRYIQENASECKPTSGSTGIGDINRRTRSTLRSEKSKHKGAVGIEEAHSDSDNHVNKTCKMDSKSTDDTNSGHESESDTKDHAYVKPSGSARRGVAKVPFFTVQGQDTYTCSVCTKMFRHRSSILRHIRGHKEPELIRRCPHCPYQTLDTTYYVEHLANLHKVDPEGNPLPPDIRCTMCDFRCVTRQRLKSHTKRKHSEGRPHKCSECDHAAITKGDLSKHMISVHVNERPFVCETCGFRSKTRSNFNTHLKSHTGLKAFKCEICEKAFTTKHKLKQHKTIHSGSVKPYVCHICGHASWRRDGLQMHLKRKHQATLDDREDFSLHLDP